MIARHFIPCLDLQFRHCGCFNQQPFFRFAFAGVITNK
jgi:hypothetical protein